MMKLADLSTEIARRWPGEVEAPTGRWPVHSCELSCASKMLPEVCAWLFNAAGYSFAGLIVEEGASQWELRHVFYGKPDMGWVHALAGSPLAESKAAQHHCGRTCGGLARARSGGPFRPDLCRATRG